MHVRVILLRIVLPIGRILDSMGLQYSGQSSTLNAKCFRDSPFYHRFASIVPWTIENAKSRYFVEQVTTVVNTKSSQKSKSDSEGLFRLLQAAGQFGDRSADGWCTFLFFASRVTESPCSSNVTEGALGAGLTRLVQLS